MKEEIEIITTHMYPPIPIRDYDWMSYRDGDEEGIIGWGETKQEAIDDLLYWEERV
jgi:hypothetical protein